MKAVHITPKPCLAAVTLALALTASGCREKFHPYCADDEGPGADLTAPWSDLGLKFPDGAKVCECSDTSVTVAGTGEPERLEESLRTTLQQQGFVLDEEVTAESDTSGSYTHFAVGLRQGLYGVRLTVEDGYDGYMFELRSFAPFSKYRTDVLERDRPSGTLVGLKVQIAGAIKDSANKDNGFWGELRFVMGDTLELRSDFARRAEVERAYQNELRDPKELLKALDLARDKGLAVRVIDIEGVSDPRLSPLQAIAVGALASDDVALVELVPKDARPDAEATAVVGLFQYQQSQGYVYLGNLDAFKGASISPDDRKPRGAAKKASTPRASAKQAAPKPPGAVGSGAASDADRYVITVTP